MLTTTDDNDSEQSLFSNDGDGDTDNAVKKAVVTSKWLQLK